MARVPRVVPIEEAATIEGDTHASLKQLRVVMGVLQAGVRSAGFDALLVAKEDACYTPQQTERNEPIGTCFGFILW